MLFSSTYSFCFASIRYLGSYFFDLNVCIGRLRPVLSAIHTYPCNGEAYYIPVGKLKPIAL